MSEISFEAFPKQVGSGTIASCELCYSQLGDYVRKSRFSKLAILRMLVALAKAMPLIVGSALARRKYDDAGTRMVPDGDEIISEGSTFFYLDL